MNESGITVIAALISPSRVDRAKARSIIDGHFFK
jgi:adenylylsulfate kinase-like enzyme